MRGVLEDEGGLRVVRGEDKSVHKVMLSSSIMSCSFLVVRTGAGGSGRAKALHVVEAGTAAAPVVVSADML